MDFEAELAKFQPSLDIEQAEDAIYGNSTTDVTDLVQSILSEAKKKEKNKSVEWVEESSTVQDVMQK